MPDQDLVSIDVVSVDSRVRVRVGGELDVASAPRLRQALAPFVDGHPAYVELDLSEVAFIDSTGVGVLVGAAKRLNGTGGSLDVVAASPGVHRVLEMTGVLGILAR